jgi:3-phenylpropionate/cinnamic acid dioxygenase small subunit
MSSAEPIRRLLARYCQYLDDRRYADWTALFAADAVWTIRDQTMRGRAEMTAYMERLIRDRPRWRTRHTCGNLVIDLEPEGTRAHVTSDLAMLARNGDEPWRVVTLGRYDDQVEQTSDRVNEWQFRERRLTVA